MILIVSSRSVWAMARRRPTVEMPKVTKRSSSNEWSGSTPVADRASRNTVAASSNETPCLARFSAALAGSHAKRNHASLTCPLPNGGSRAARAPVGCSGLLARWPCAHSVRPAVVKLLPTHTPRGAAHGRICAACPGADAWGSRERGVAQAQAAWLPASHPARGHADGVEGLVEVGPGVHGGDAVVPAAVEVDAL